MASELPDENELIDLDEPLQLANFRLPPPREFLTSEKESIMKSSMSRIWNTNGLLGNSTAAFSDQQVGQGASSEDLWMLLLVRMITRASPGEGAGGVDEGEKLESMQVGGVSVKERIRQIVFDYVLTDFPGRLVFIYIYILLIRIELTPPNKRAPCCDLDERGVVQRPDTNSG